MGVSKFLMNEQQNVVFSFMLPAGSNRVTMKRRLTLTILSLFFLLFGLINSVNADELTKEDVLQYVKDTYTFADGMDAFLDQALDEHPSHITAPFLDVFKVIIRVIEVAKHLRNEDYQDAVNTATKYIAELAIRDTFLGSLSSTFAIAELATLPIKWSLSNFTDEVVGLAWNRQAWLYTWARIMGYSHEFIMNGQSDDTVIFTDDGWLYIVGDEFIPAYAPVRPGDYSQAQVYGSAQEIYYSYLAIATY
ncbi:MAG: hypothetical protein JRE64_08325, partial [Deltaproteobacteria bacterium]|nr:hypothetical protein [Deltaproteobacteria bacterium]